jgi:hypothetical protein
VTTPALEFRSTGEWLVWSTGARAKAGDDVAPDLYGARPGEQPVLLYDNPERDSRLEVVGGFGSRFAFIEVNRRVFGQSGWRLWYVGGPGSKPSIVDQGSGGQLPFFTMSAGRLVWTAITAGPGPKGTLRSMNLISLQKTTLLASPAQSQTFWFPWLDDERLVYGTIESSDGGETEQRHVYYLDLSNPDGAPQRLDGSTSASEPVIRGDIVIWKESDPRLNFLAAGHLVRHSLSSGATKPLELPAGAPTLGFTVPSIGNHFAVAWPQYDRAIYLADLDTETFPALIDLGRTNDDPHDAVVRPFVLGDLLAYTFGPATGDLELRWAILP